MIPDGYTDLAPGKIAAVVTYLEMLECPARARTSSVRLREIKKPDLNWYRGVFRRAGEHWLWWSRLEMTDAHLSAVLNAPTTAFFIAESGGSEVGIAEMDRAEPGQVEIAFFGLYAEALGKGLGRAFIDTLLERAWTESTSSAREGGEMIPTT